MEESRSLVLRRCGAAEIVHVMRLNQFEGLDTFVDTWTKCRTTPLDGLRITYGRFSFEALMLYQIDRFMPWFMVVPKGG